MWEGSQLLVKNIARITGKRNSRKAWIGSLTAAISMKIMLKTELITVDTDLTHSYIILSHVEPWAGINVENRVISLKTKAWKIKLHNKTYECNVLFACILDQEQVTKYFCCISSVMYLVYYNCSNAGPECQASRTPVCPLI